MTIGLAFLLAFAANAQKINASKVPAVVKASFAKAYPAVAAKWEKEDGNYEVNFNKGGHAMSAVIERNGSIIETETAIKISDLPVKVAAYVKEHYSGNPIKESSMIINADRSESYEARVDGKDLIFDRNGKFIKEAKD